MQAITPDGTKFVTTYLDQVRVWDLETVQVIQLIEDVGYTHAVSPDGSTLVYTRSVKSAEWGTNYYTEAKKLNQDFGRQMGGGTYFSIQYVGISPDATKAMSSCLSGYEYYNIENGSKLFTLSQTNIQPILTNDVAIQIVDQNIQVYDMNKSITTTLSGHTEPVSAVAISPDGTMIISGSKDQTLKIWDIKTGKEICTLSENAGVVTAITMTSDGSKIITGSDKTLKIWDVKSALDSKVISSQGIKIWTAPTAKSIFAKSIGSPIAVTPDGTKLVSAVEGKVCDFETGKLLYTLNDIISTVSITTDGSKIIGLDSGNNIKIFEVSTGRTIVTIPTSTGFTFAVSPDQTKIISATKDNLVKIWDINSGQVVFTLWMDYAPQYIHVLSADMVAILSESMIHKLKIQLPIELKSKGKKLIYLFVNTPQP